MDTGGLEATQDQQDIIELDGTVEDYFEADSRPIA